MSARNVCVAFLAAALVTARWAEAAPAPLAPMTADASAALEGLIARGRVANPESFRTLAKLRDEVPVLARKARSGKINVRALLVVQGKGALPAILGELRDGPEASPGGWHAPGATSWTIGLLEAAGHWREPASAPVFEAVALHPRAEVAVAAAAVRALGALATDDAVRRLESIYAARGDLRQALAPAMGECRRLAMVRFLAQKLEGALPADAAPLVMGLGQAASAWPWHTPALEQRGEGDAARRMAFDVLVGRYASADEALRPAVVEALWLVDLSDGPSLVRGRNVTPRSPAAAALAELATKLEKSPLRR